MQDTWFFLALSGFGLFGGGYWFFRQLARARLLEDTPTSKVRSAAQGFVELYGVLKGEAEAMQEGPLTGTPCLWWRFKIEERTGSGDKKSWRTLESGVSEAGLLLDDGTGTCLIDPRGAEVRPANKRVWKGSERHPRQRVSTGLIGSVLGGVFGKEYRYTEERLHAGEPLYALGHFTSHGAAREGFNAALEVGAVVREWKQDYQALLQRFDYDRNGQLDEQEWQRVRQEAGWEADKRFKTRLNQGDQHRLSDSKSLPFVLSSAGEDELAQHYRWHAVGGLLAALAGTGGLIWLSLKNGWLLS
ncbi:GIDE domain-containing protein [Atopomonas sediminilitoris]|uniref:GIDE domain-containing protein n=1 Tax=Atopomonas sediminilitoris TaxID=2919919 RepID=UPI001F4E2FD6|nr:GIDE domain-containing protein [Atopomonas sediminilitoris]MCJ8168710.1 hypothetical protein [Atopomonas sediminilitoris]